MNTSSKAGATSGLRIALVTLALCGALAVSVASSFGGTRPVSNDRAIAVALGRFGGGWMFSAFPRKRGRVLCQIPAGGLNGGTVTGNCQTRVTTGRTYVAVTFTETWDSSAFNGETGPTSGALTHTWLVIESKKLTAVDASTFGDFPPQWVR